MKISVCVESARTVTAGGWSSAEMHCLPHVIVYVEGILLLFCVIFTIRVLVTRK